MKKRNRKADGRPTVWILGDQLTPEMSALRGLRGADCQVLMIESRAQAQRRPYHKKKIALVWSAMRHFGNELRELGYEVDYRCVQPDYRAGIRAHLKCYGPKEVRLMETAEFGASRRLAEIVQGLGVRTSVQDNNMFLSDRAEFAKKARKTRSLRLESFYRDMRRRTGLLMDGAKPEGGRWNYDAENRRIPAEGHVFPKLPEFEPDRITREVLECVEREFPNLFGELDGFDMPVTRRDADSFLGDFIAKRLDAFGPYQDAMVRGERALYHSLLSPLINIGLLNAMDVCRDAEAAYRKGNARLASVEGLIRQILGWREFVYQVYHSRMPGYTKVNALEADLPLPEFYWSAETPMRCIAEAVSTVRRYGINHHIQRLMVTGNFALIAGIDPQTVNEWYRTVYVDAFDWVVSPNVLGMSLYADGGLMASKPYAASANYINRMSDYCKGCAYDAKKVLGERACPFNALYWDFLARNARRLRGNPRMNLVLANLKRRERRTLEKIRSRAAEVRERLRCGVSV